MQTFDDLCGTQTHKRTESVKQKLVAVNVTNSTVKASVPVKSREGSRQKANWEHATRSLASGWCVFARHWDILGWSAFLLVSASTSSGRRFVFQHLTDALIVAEQLHNLLTPTDATRIKNTRTIYCCILQNMQLMTNGSETWRSTKALINKIKVCIKRSLRRILGIRWYDKMRNVDLRKAMDQESAK